MSPLERFLAGHPDLAVARIDEVRGSAPRGAGTVMLVAEDALFGTIGGGHVEHAAIAAAREMLRNKGAANPSAERLEFALGQDINQCCGGRIVVTISMASDVIRAELLHDAALQQSRLPEVVICGAGHVGLALARALAPLPFSVRLIDVRPELASAGAEVFALPEQAVRDAKAGAAVVVTTHDHALDYVLVSEALKRADLAYVGLIGSATKRGVFRNQWARDGGAEDVFSRLVCPIGANATGDKRPEVIAAFTAAELCSVLLAPQKGQGNA